MHNILEVFNKHFHIPFSSSVLVFSVFLLIIFLSPIIFRRLRIPDIIGLIIFGMVVGPHGFNLIEKNSAVDLLSTIGLLYLMFIAGLELDLNKFIKFRNRSVVFGALTFIDYPYVIIF
jgi:Kef-type K+ transport system membrane component KefB